MLQTVYADLLDRVNAVAFAEAFPADGTFTAKMIRGRRYWYFQKPISSGRVQQYVGPESPELLARIAAHKAARDVQRDQRSLVATLIRAANLSKPPSQIGDLVEALAKERVFRLRGVLVGTVAYQTYSAMLGVRLSATLMQTGDVDVAQFADVSAAIGDATRPALEMLQSFDPTFQPIPQINSQGASSYRTRHLRVDFLTPNRGKDTEQPQKLPAFGTDAQPLRFLDFLIRDPEPAVLLHGAGVLVSVPSPQRFALHKLIVARRRREGGKREKDVLQAQALLDVLVRRRTHDLASAWREAFARGKTWQRLLGEGLGLLHPATRDAVLRAVGERRSVVPGLDLNFLPDKETYDREEDEVVVFAQAGSEGVQCRIPKETFEICFGPGRFDREGCLTAFHQHRSHIEQAARAKYLNQQPAGIGHALLLTSTDLAPRELPA